MIRFSRSPTNRLSKYYLAKWYYFDNNIDLLNPVEEIKMKTLYASLKTLNDYELEFLSEKYRVERKPYIKDYILAEYRGVSLMEYRTERIKIEDKLTKELLKQIDYYQEELSEAVRS